MNQTACNAFDFFFRHESKQTTAYRKSLEDIRFNLIRDFAYSCKEEDRMGNTEPLSAERKKIGNDLRTLLDSLTVVITKLGGSPTLTAEQAKTVITIIDKNDGYETSKNTPNRL